jgi:hypothetical protein
MGVSLDRLVPQFVQQVDRRVALQGQGSDATSCTGTEGSCFRAEPETVRHESEPTVAFGDLLLVAGDEGRPGIALSRDHVAAKRPMLEKLQASAGPRRIVGAVTEPHAVRRLLWVLGLAAEERPPRGRLVVASSFDRPRRLRSGLPAAAAAPGDTRRSGPARGFLPAPRPLARHLRGGVSSPRYGPRPPGVALGPGETMPDSACVRLLDQRGGV